MEPLDIAGESVPPGTRLNLELPAARLATGTALTLPVTIAHGTADGPRLWLSAAIHGDELNGVDIIRRVMARIDPRALTGTVFAVPVVNVFGFIEQSRYLPDRRDLNRSFPGSPKGSLAARLAHLFMEEIVSRSTHGIDLHTGSHHRTNLPHVRANLNDPETLRCAEAFGTTLIVHAESRDGSLRQAAAQRGIPCLLYEAGQASRFEEPAIHSGVTGVLRVMQTLGMQDFAEHSGQRPMRTAETKWVRARRSGIFRPAIDLGQPVEQGNMLGVIADFSDDGVAKVRAPCTGVVLGLSLNPLVYRGDGIVHVACTATVASES